MPIGDISSNNYDKYKINTPIDNPNISQATPGNKWEKNENITGSAANVSVEKKLDEREDRLESNKEIAHDALSSTSQEKILNKIISNHSDTAL